MELITRPQFLTVNSGNSKIKRSGIIADFPAQSWYCPLHAEVKRWHQALEKSDAHNPN